VTVVATLCTGKHLLREAT